ncbi:MAG: LysR family transcriptional regulator [Pseudomonadota bacterium]|nr:LysR family transcriptional regulator [Pseudomonadota bacterium]
MDTNRISLDDMALFAEVVQAGSFTAAGSYLGLPKSSVSRRVARLERQLDARLLNRTTRALRLTDIGRVYFQHCQRLVHEAREAVAEVVDLQKEPAGTVRLSVASNFAPLSGKLLADFLRQYETIRIELIASDRVVDLVAEGIDFALRFGALPDSGLTARKLGTTRGMLCASPEYLERHGHPRNLDDLQHHTCIHYGLGPRDHVWRFHGEHGMQTVEAVGRLAVNDFQTMGEAALHGLGIAALPDMLFGAQIEAGRLVPLLPEWRFRPIDLSLVYPGGRHLPRRSRVFITFVTDWFERHHQAGRAQTKPGGSTARQRRRSPAARKN